MDPDNRTEGRGRHCAVLIDADNASASHAVAVFEEIAKYGEANVRRIYGDFSGARLKGWRDRMQPLAILPQQQFNYTTGKNAADITLVIDAMDLMHTSSVEVFCLISSDSDFTRLAQRLRESGKTVIGFGERKTPEAFRNACNRFIYFDNLGAAETAARAGSEDLPEAPERQPPSKAVPLILRAVDELADDDGWVRLGPVGQHLIANHPDFDARNYGCAKLSDLVKKTGRFSLDKTPGGGLKIKRKARRSSASEPKSK